MDANGMNIYKNARKSAGLTQERWAEYIGVSVDAIRKYEGGTQIPADDIVSRMIDVACMPVLACWHLKLKSGLANDLLPEVEQLPLAQAVVQLMADINDLTDKNVIRELLQISKDGKVTEDELPRFEAVVSELDDVIRDALAIKYAQGRGG